MTNRFYSAPIDKIETFVYPEISGTGTISHLGDLDGLRYHYVDEGVPLPTSEVARFQPVEMTDDLIVKLRAVAVHLSLPLIPLTQGEIEAALTRQVQERLDEFVRTHGYDNILSACTYATSTVPKFASDGQYCVEARDATWAAAYAILDDALAGNRPMPGSIEEIEGELPTLVWPAS
jgi:hypothetical protein